MPRVREHAADVPDRLLRQRKVIGQEAAAVLLREEAVEAPQAVGQRADVEQVHHQQVAGFHAFDPDRSAEEMHGRQVDVTDIVGRIVVLDVATGPVEGLDHEVVPRLDPCRHRNVRMPAVVDQFVVVGRPVEVDLDDGVRHGCSLLLLNGTARKTGCPDQADRSDNPVLQTKRDKPVERRGRIRRVPRGCGAPSAGRRSAAESGGVVTHTAR